MTLPTCLAMWSIQTVCYKMHSSCLSWLNSLQIFVLAVLNYFDFEGFYFSCFQFWPGRQGWAWKEYLIFKSCSYVYVKPFLYNFFLSLAFLKFIKSWLIICQWYWRTDIFIWCHVISLVTVNVLIHVCWKQWNVQLNFSVSEFFFYTRTSNKYFLTSYIERYYVWKSSFLNVAFKTKNFFLLLLAIACKEIEGKDFVSNPLSIDI